MKNREVMKSCAWCGKKFDANKNWYKPRLPDLCPVCRKDMAIVYKFRTLKMEVK